jgi:tetratricopeptide (TPR) repeat protein
VRAAVALLLMSLCACATPAWKLDNTLFHTSPHVQRLEWPRATPESQAAASLVRSARVAVAEGDPLRGLRLADLAVGLDPHCARAWVTRAWCHEDLGHPAEALTCARRVLDEQMAAAAGDLREAGHVLLKGDALELAARAYERELDFDSDDAVSEYNLGLIRYDQGDYARAEALLTKARERWGLDARCRERAAHFCEQARRSR